MKCYKNWQTKWKTEIEFSSLATHWIQESCFLTLPGVFDMMFYAIFITFVLNSTAFGWVVQLQMRSWCFFVKKQKNKKKPAVLAWGIIFALLHTFDHPRWYLSDGSARTDVVVLERIDSAHGETCWGHVQQAPYLTPPLFCPVCPAHLCWTYSRKCRNEGKMADG